MGIDISKLALKAARAVIGDSPGQASKPERKRPRKRRLLRDHLPPAGPLVTGAAIAVAGRAAVRSRGGDWWHALQERLDLGDEAPEDEDRESELDQPQGSEAEEVGGEDVADEDAVDEEAEDEEVEDEESPDDGAEETDEPASQEAADDGNDTAEAEPDVDDAADADDTDGRPARVVALAPRGRMSPVRRRKLAESAARAES